jgi:ADP-ribosylglycohydrolase
MELPVSFPVDVRNYLHLMREQGADTAAWRDRAEKLMERLPGPEREAHPEWRALEREVLAAAEALTTPEPVELEDILRARPASRVDAYPSIPDAESLENRILGAWLGRVAGCILGKPVECLMREKDSRAALRSLLVETGEYPMRDFVSKRTMDHYWSGNKDKPAWLSGDNPSLREFIQYAPSDDDLNYTTISLEILRRKGVDFSPDDVLDVWLHTLPFSAVFTAELVAYRNAVMGLRHPEAARFLNPYYEWIGAQIRADLYGYIHPGQPERAARMAYRDAACSHLKNGVYGAMWVAAALAAAFCEDDPETVVRRGMEQIPENSRLFEHLEKTIAACGANGDDFEKTFDDIQARLGEYHCVHTVNNACVVAAALLHGRGDFGRTVCVAVMGGLDTDCNGATAGSIAGLMMGAKSVPSRWKDRFNDTLHTSIAGRNVVRIGDLARETLKWVQR